MLRGHIDTITSSGYVEGWAVDSERQFSPIHVSVDRMGQCVAEGLAHLYREDLAVVGFSAGWCAFRLHSSLPVASMRNCPLALLDESGTLIGQFSDVGYRFEGFDSLTDLDMIVNNDPTLLPTLDKLAGCTDIFDNFVKARGIDAFIRAAYVYILGRPVDADGRRGYGKLLRQGGISPYALLHVLSDSDEYRARRPQLTAPTMAGFPFKL